MEKTKLEELRYPIGKYEVPSTISEDQVLEWIRILEHYPNKLELLVKELSTTQLETPYRPDGWTVRQVIHHVADSHHHSYIRFKWALTEETPVIKPYLEKKWAALFDSRTAPIELSLKHLSAVHAKLVYLLKGLSSSDLKRSFVHPESQESTTIIENIGRYVWHGNHHYNHIKNLLKREGWI
ncbi:YfiT family bacillithiol transferase [uncultured Eudoraea sp.]|uniref:YfiT family bacillithiol transferase n=1 Tax=uncultured Eudoraea sp. TaxID=1035614 RepID=UPI0026053F00|nr:bacillithiol transferase BstA [uncultured Eudoraea sp.]